MKLIIDIDEVYYKAICERVERFGKGSIVLPMPEKIIFDGTPLEDIVDGIESHKWGNNEGSKEIYNNAIDDVLTYIEEKLGE